MDKKKILLIANTARFLVLFERNDMKILMDMGYEVHCASNFSGELDETDAVETLESRGAVVHQIDIARSPLSLGNGKALRQTVRLMEENRFDAVHCHTPMGAVLARLAARRCGIRPVIYTVHGLHFYKGAPLKNWLLYYPVESCLSRFTDLIITINREDYGRAKRMHAKKTVYIPGIGIETKEYGPSRAVSHALREELGISDDEIVLLTVGDLIARKNQKTAICALAKLLRKDIRYVVCGRGELMEEYEKLSEELGVRDQVLFTGYRKDIREFYQMADIFVFPSYQEGLSVAVMEAMASGLPCILSRIRGNVDLLKDGEGGYLLDPDDAEGFAEAIRELSDSSEVRERMMRANLERIKEFDLARVDARMKKIYRAIL